MAAIDNLTQAIVDLTKAIDGVLASPPGVPETAVQSAADAVTAQALRLVPAAPPGSGSDFAG